MCYFMVKMGYYKGINHSDYQSSYPRESSEFRLCQGQVRLVNHCKVEDHNSRNITGAYCDIRLYYNTRLYVIPEYIIDVQVL